MAATVIQAGNLLKMLDENGNPTDLTLPTGIILRTDVPPRWVQFNNYVVLVNTPSQPLTIDSTGTVRLLSPKGPRVAPVLGTAAGGSLTGTYTGVRVTFVTLDGQGNIISESDYSPPSGTQAVSAQYLKVTNIDTSPDQITLRRLYRPTSNGAVLYQWLDLDGNVQTQVQDDLADNALSLFGAPRLGTPPHLTMIAEFRGRLWGISDTSPDYARFTQAGIQYAWPGTNLVQIPQIGTDAQGISALIPRREALGVARRNMFVQITGTGQEDTSGIADFTAIILSRELGVESQESVKVFRDTAYFLWKDGVYAWGTDGVTCVSDKADVRRWFSTDDYFNRAMFTKAFSVIDPYHPHYRLFLASAGSNVIDSWVDYDINAGKFFGPHNTAAFQPVSAFSRLDSSDKVVPMIGGTGHVYQDQATRTDYPNTAIAVDIVGKRHDGGDPIREKYFGELMVMQKDYPTGTLQVTSRVGNLNEGAGDVTPNYTTLTQQDAQQKDRVRLGRLGTGKHCEIEIQNNEVGQDLALYGYEINPVNIVGQR